MIDESAIGARYGAVASLLDERARRLLAGTEARAIGRGGMAAVARATGLARSTVQRGAAEVRAGRPMARGRIRREGAGRPRSEERDPTLRRGSLDAIHLASALLVREQGDEMLFATHDQQLAVAARAMGFAVDGVSTQEPAARRVDEQRAGWS